VKRVERRDELSEMLQERFTDRTTAEWEERFSSRKVLFAPVNTFSELFNHPQAEAMKLVVDVEHPKAGVQRQLAAAIRMTDTRHASTGRRRCSVSTPKRSARVRMGSQRGRRPGGERRGPGRTARLILAADARLSTRRSDDRSKNSVLLCE